MNQKILIGVVVVVLVFAVFQIVQIASLKKTLTSGGTPTVSAATSQGGETYEQMMARMHPDQKVASSSQGAAMVGGC